MVVKALKQYGSLMCERTRRMHAEFKRALVGLAVSPLVAVILPVTCNIATLSLRLNGGILTAYTTTFCSSIVFLNPLITVAVVRAYRTAVQQYARILFNILLCHKANSVRDV